MEKSLLAAMDKLGPTGLAEALTEARKAKLELASFEKQRGLRKKAEVALLVAIGKPGSVGLP